MSQGIQQLFRKAFKIAHDAATQGGKMPSAPKWEAQFTLRLVGLHEIGTIDLDEDAAETILDAVNHMDRGESVARAARPTASTMYAARLCWKRLQRITKMEDMFEDAIGTRCPDPSDLWEGDLDHFDYGTLAVA